MKQNILLVFILFVLLIGCKRDPLPKDAIDSETYINVLVDVHIAEALYNDRFRLKIDSLESTSLYLSVLESYEVSEEEMLITSLYYSRHQKEYKKIFTEVLDRISIMIEEENARQELVIETDSVVKTNIELKVMDEQPKTQLKSPK